MPRYTVYFFLYKQKLKVGINIEVASIIMVKIDQQKIENNLRDIYSFVFITEG